jgi:hypothetical protein
MPSSIRFKLSDEDAATARSFCRYQAGVGSPECPQALGTAPRDRRTDHLQTTCEANGSLAAALNRSAKELA